MTAVGGVDTYYDYDEQQWKLRRLGGGPVRREPVCPSPDKPEVVAPARARAPRPELAERG